MWGKSGAVEEEEGVEIIMSNRGVDYVIEKKKTNHVIYSAPIDVTAALYSAPIAVTIAVTSRSGAITAIALL
ncbi:hypothetical protein L249_4272 [Ophiocordyceps polyrhachis-furcata BCC 54312]|uniref:Uncharacterized protein n=1 Tax=Ophiocordyceps polyrhachis-furcata BCC 54312 TaxID=1330021 RepID=A0A367L7P0_9HYPO|nr:hypothetical protein L249_4272 [Ophiocordyceps polyrhachis-furcata BCC 54312]